MFTITNLLEYYFVFDQIQYNNLKVQMYLSSLTESKTILIIID